MMLTFYKFFNDNKKKLKAKLFKPFFFKYCWTNWTFKWGKKNYLLAPFSKFTSFKRVAANLCIIWSESNDILTKKWKKYKKLTLSLQFWMQTKNIGSNSSFAKVYSCLTSTYPYLCEQTSMFLDFQMIILFVPSVASLSVAVNLKFCPCCPLLGCHAHNYPTTGSS